MKQLIADALSWEELGEIHKTEYQFELGKGVLHNVSTWFEAGKAYAIVGGSGSGKSTLLNLLTAANIEYSGSITLVHCCGTINAVLYNLSGRKHLVTIDETLIANLPVSEVELKTSVLQSKVCTADEFSHLNHHLFIITISSYRANTINQHLIFLDMDEILDLLNLASHSQTKIENATLFVKRVMLVNVSQELLNNVCDLVRIVIFFHG